MSQTSLAQACYHCGTDCDTKRPHVRDGHHFCCSGCETVYSILSHNSLEDYYSLATKPGIKTETPAEGKFDYLNDIKVIEQLSDFYNDDRIHITFDIPQIHCHACIWLLEKLPSLKKGILTSKVNFTKKTAHIELDARECSLSEVADLLSHLGYTPSISQEKEADKRHRKFDRSTIIKLGIAGFCFGNVMLLSFPEYISGVTSIPLKYSYFFGLLSWALSTLQIAIAGKQYFTSSFEALKRSRINMNIPVTLGIIALYGASAYEVVSQTGPGYFDSLTGFLFFLLIGKIFQQKTFDQLSFERDYKSYFPMSVLKIIGDKEQSTPVMRLEVGDRIVLRHEDVIPADGLLMSSHAHLNYSFVTGESDAIKKVAGEILYAGGRIKGNGVTMEVTKTADHSYLTRLWNKQNGQDSDSNLTSISDRIATWFTWIVLVIATTSGVYWGTSSLHDGIRVFTSVLIVACPCALALAVPFAYGNMVRHFAKHQFFLKDTSVVERLSDLDTLVFDKTGTLTDPEKIKVDYVGKDMTLKQRIAVKSLVRQSSHPLSQAIFDHINTTSKDVQQFEEIRGKGLQGYVSGHFIKLGSHAFVFDNTESKKTGSSVYISIDNQFIGFFTFESVYRSGVPDTVTQLSGDYQLAMVSGDGTKDDSSIRAMFPCSSHLAFQQSPFEKKELIQNWQLNGQKTAMLGDGLNDAGALKASYTGIAVTEHLNRFTPASDAILLADHIPLLPRFLSASKDTRRAVYICFGISFAYNSIGLFFALQGLLSPITSAILMPLSSITVAISAILLTNSIARKFSSSLFKRSQN